MGRYKSKFDQTTQPSESKKQINQKLLFQLTYVNNTSGFIKLNSNNKHIYLFSVKNILIFRKLWHLKQQQSESTWAPRTLAWAFFNMEKWKLLPTTKETVQPLHM